MLMARGSTESTTYTVSARAMDGQLRHMTGIIAWLQPPMAAPRFGLMASTVRSYGRCSWPWTYLILGAHSRLTVLLFTLAPKEMSNGRRRLAAS
jgi:hypothetical protein